MKFSVSLFLLVVLCIAASDAAPRNSFAGRYEGTWGKPGGLKIRDADTGAIDEVQRGFRSTISFRIPSGAGRRNGAIDVTPLFPGGIDPTFIARVITDYGEPEIRRRGKLAIYRARVELKPREIPFLGDSPGTFLVRILKRGSRHVVKRGNLQMIFNPGAQNPLKYTGQVRGRKS